MNRTFRIPPVVTAMLVAFALAPAAARADEGVGSVRGKVVKSDGSRVANATVRLMERSAPRKRKAADAAAQPTAQPGDAEPAKPKKPRPAPTAEATTNAQGEFALTNVPAGRYVLAARLKGEGNGRQPVTVTAGGFADVTLTLKPRGERKAGAGAADATRVERRKARLQRRHERAAQQRAAQ